MLKLGGYFLFKTPNRRHYVPMIATITSPRFKVWVNQLRGRLREDTFPTFYAANTPEDIDNLASNTGLVIEKLMLVEGRPEYCRLAAILYLVGAGYERLVNRFHSLSRFRVLLVGLLRKVR